jgi:2-polyprenyl-3-methyl-5-hydroxy-6-metoxy-1,4-benzoquinol methylase
MNLTARIAQAWRSIFTLMLLRKVTFRSKYHRLRLLYFFFEDPWRLKSADEHHRYETINAMINVNNLPTTSILEIGCGEGTHTKYLCSLSDCVTAIDISETAIQRAQKNLDINAKFHVVDAVSFLSNSKENFDLGVASEVLYYMDDPEGLLRLLHDRCRCVLVSFYDGEFKRMNEVLSKINGKKYWHICRGTTSWHCYYWSSNEN